MVLPELPETGAPKDCRYISDMFSRRDPLGLYGLSSKEIARDGCFHYLPTSEEAQRGLSAWYIASLDRHAVEFGNPAAGLERAYWDAGGHGYGNTGPTEPPESAARAIGQANTIWKRATGTVIVTGHPYLAGMPVAPDLNKKLKLSKRTEAGGFGVPDGLLLAPMRWLGGKLVNLQLIRPDGIRRFVPDAPVHDTWTLIGGSCLKGGNRTLYVCVDWATGWTIHYAAKCAVAVAFCATSLRSVTVRLKEHYKCRVIVAADNDRWNDFDRGRLDSELAPNPGVHFARQAAEAAEAGLAIPDFESLRGCPVSFLDLWQREGIDAVRSCLEPTRHGEAITTRCRKPAMDEDDHVLDAPRIEEPDARLADAPFRCLGFSGPPFSWWGPNRYYFRAADGKVVELTDGQLGRSKNLIRLTEWRSDWWRERFRGHDRRSPVDCSEAYGALIDECFRAGRFDAEQIRGTGCWRDEHGNVVVNLGEQLLAPGATRLIRPEAYDGGSFAYDRSYSAPEPMWTNPLSLTDARDLLATLERLCWDDDAAGALFAGFLALGPLCGALDRRPHLWITGCEGARRATLTGEEVAGALLGGMYTVLQDPGNVRTDLVREAVVMIYDCLWIDSKLVATDMRSALKLAYTSATNVPVTEATRSGIPREVAHPSLVLLSSSSVPRELSRELGKYVTHLHLRDPSLIANERESRNARWGVRLLRRHLQSPRGRDIGHRLRARTLRWLRSGMFDRLLEVTTAVAEETMEWPRRKAGHHVLAAGAMMLCFDAVPGEKDVREWFRQRGLTSDAEGGARAGYEVLAQLLGGELELRLSQGSPDRIAVNTLLKYVIDGEPRFVPSPSATQIRKHDRWSKARRALARAGLRVEDNALLVANKSDWIEDQLADSPYAADWKAALRTIPKAHAGPSRRVVYGKRTKSRTTVIPLRALKNALTTL